MTHNRPFMTHHYVICWWRHWWVHELGLKVYHIFSISFKPMKLDWLLIFDVWVIVMTHGYEFFLVHLKSLLAGPTRILYLSRNSCWWPISDHGLVHTLGSSLLIPPTQLRIIPNVSFTPLNSIYALSLFQINYTNKLFSSKKNTCSFILAPNRDKTEIWW